MANAFVSPTTRATGYVVTAANWNADVKTNVDELADFHGVLCPVTAGTTIGAADTAVLLDAPTFDTDSFAVVAGGHEHFTVPAGMGGYYQITINLTFAAGADTHDVYIKVNNAHVFKSTNTGIAGQVTTVNVTGIYHLAAADHVDFEAASTVNRATSNTNGESFACMHLLNRDG